MNLARVIGTCVATIKSEGLEGLRLLVIQPLDERYRPLGRPVVAADAVQAGPGDVVHTVSSREAALAFEPSFVPVDCAIVGIVDAVNVDHFIAEDAP
jgi:ethanolamine utilization protein EutN